MNPCHCHDEELSNHQQQNSIRSGVGDPGVGQADRRVHDGLAKSMRTLHIGGACMQASTGQCCTDTTLPSTSTVHAPYTRTQKHGRRCWSGPCLGHFEPALRSATVVSNRLHQGKSLFSSLWATARCQPVAGRAEWPASARRSGCGGEHRASARARPPQVGTAALLAVHARSMGRGKGKGNNGTVFFNANKDSSAFRGLPSSAPDRRAGGGKGERAGAAHAPTGHPAGHAPPPRKKSRACRPAIPRGWGCPTARGGRRKPAVRRPPLPLPATPRPPRRGAQ